MSAWGRRSALLSARKEALETLRDALTECNSADIDELTGPASSAIEAAQRLQEIAKLWGEAATNGRF